VRTYAVCGGMPYYLERFHDGSSLADNILRLVLYRDGLLHEEAELLLRQELNDPHNYFSVLRAIASGQTRNSQICNRVGLSTAQVSQITAVLERLRLIEQRRPVTASARSKKTTYAIVDGFLNFHFRFVDPYRSLLRTRAGAEQHRRQTVLPQLEHFVSKPAFEDICRRYLQQAEQARAVGGWWGPVPTGEGRRTEQREVDAVALDQASKVVAIGSCKWTATPVGLEEEALLTRLQAHIPGAEGAVRHYFFSRSGFEDSLRRLAEAEPERLRLITPEDLYE
jgi:uncharacterized protein